MFPNAWQCDPLSYYLIFWLASNATITLIALLLLGRAAWEKNLTNFGNSILLAVCGLVASVFSTGYLIVFHLLHSCLNPLVDSHYSQFVKVSSAFSGISLLGNLSMYWLAAMNYFSAAKIMP